MDAGLYLGHSETSQPRDGYNATTTSPQSWRSESSPAFPRTSRAVPDVPAEQELDRNLRGERDPAAEDPHDALFDVAVVTNQPGGSFDGEGAGERMRRHGRGGA